MAAPGVVELEISSQSLAEVCRRLVGTQVHVFVLDAAPQTLDEHVIDPAALAVHADGDVMGLESTCERLRGELGTLVGVEDLRGTKALYGLLQRLDAEVRVQGVRYAPGQHAA